MLWKQSFSFKTTKSISVGKQKECWLLALMSCHLVSLWRRSPCKKKKLKIIFWGGEGLAIPRRYKIASSSLLVEESKPIGNESHFAIISNNKAGEVWRTNSHFSCSTRPQCLNDKFCCIWSYLGHLKSLAGNIFPLSSNESVKDYQS